MLNFFSIKNVTATDKSLTITPSIPFMSNDCVERVIVDIPATVNTVMLFILCKAVETSKHYCTWQDIQRKFHLLIHQLGSNIL